MTRVRQIRYLIAIVSGAGILFKGSGFYTTDYRSESYKEAAKKESSSSAPSTGGEGKAAAKTDTPTKPESKAAKSKSTGK